MTKTLRSLALVAVCWGYGAMEVNATDYCCAKIPMATSGGTTLFEATYHQGNCDDSTVVWHLGQATQPCPEDCPDCVTTFDDEEKDEADPFVLPFKSAAWRLAAGDVFSKTSFRELLPVEWPAKRNSGVGPKLFWSPRNGMKILSVRKARIPCKVPETTIPVLLCTVFFDPASATIPDQAVQLKPKAKYLMYGVETTNEIAPVGSEKVATARIKRLNEMKTHGVVIYEHSPHACFIQLDDDSEPYFVVTRQEIEFPVVP